MEDRHRLTVVSYNMHGFKQGCNYLTDLCNEFDIVYIQEHWLASFDLDRLSNVSTNMTVYACSAMDKDISGGCLMGRPFGGVGILVNNTLVPNVRLVKAASRYIILQIGLTLFVNVYLPSVSTVGRDEEFIDCLSCVMNDVSDFTDCSVVFGGDMNVDFTNSNFLCKCLLDFAKDLNLRFVDDKLPHGSSSTFRVESTGAASLIDHFAVSSRLYECIEEVRITDSGINLSDHCPLILVLYVPMVTYCNLEHHNTVNNSHPLSFRWDHGDVSEYYRISHELLSCITVPSYLLNEDSFNVFNKLDTLNIVNQFYMNIIRALFEASCAAIPRKKYNFYKYWWDEELVLLKDKAIQSFNLWTALGKPHVGNVFDDMRMDKRRYKLAIKSKEKVAADQFSNSLNDALVNKDMDAFWNSWKSKFGKQQRAKVIDGCYDEKSIADDFAKMFSEVCVPNSYERHGQLRSNFNDQFCSYPQTGVASVDVETVDKCVSMLKMGKAAGIDCLMAEHIKYAHPILIVLLVTLFNILLTHSLVPDGFGQGIVIPLLKNPDLDRTDSGNYRGITLSPVISKLFEMVVMSLYEEQLNSDSLQFGFKKQSSCSHALFTVRTTVEHYVKNGCTVSICALDLSKAFDKVDHFGLLQLLMKRHLPKNLIGTLLDWFSKCIVCVRWGGALSFWFAISAGVRQGGCLSPILFAVYMDVLINRLKASKFGCRLAGEFFGCIVYADDVLLLSHSVEAMRHMLTICENFAVDFDVKFNSNKSVFMRVGERYNSLCEPLRLFGTVLQQVQQIKYLGVCLVSDKKLKCDVNHLKVKFYRAFNCIYARSKAANSELVAVQLLKSYCLPFILYASEAAPLSATNIRVLDNCINRAVYRIFGVNDGEDMVFLRNSLGLSSLCNVIESRRKNFIDRLLDNNVFTVVIKGFISNLVL